MPLYDRVCECGWKVIDVWEPVNVEEKSCPECGASTQRAWLTKSTAIIGDETDFTQINGLKHPRRFRSRAEHRRWLKENNFAVKDSHVAPLDSDKSPHTTNWGAQYDPYTANNVKILMERAFHQPSREEEPLNMHIRTDVHDMTKEEVAKYVR